MGGGGAPLTSEVEPDLVQIHLSVNHRLLWSTWVIILSLTSTARSKGRAVSSAFVINPDRTPLFHWAFISFQRTTLLRPNAFLQIWPSSSLPRKEEALLLASRCLKIRQIINNVPLLWYDQIYLGLLPQTAGHQFSLCRIFLTRNEAHRGIKDCVLLKFICHKKEVKLSYFCQDASLPGPLEPLPADRVVQRCRRPHSESSAPSICPSEPEKTLTFQFKSSNLSFDLR